MDAYVFAVKADPSVIAQLVADVAAGQVRVVCPLTGDRELYVAIDAPDDASRDAETNRVGNLPGVTVGEILIPVPGVEGEVGGDAAAYPTHCAVNAFVGFGQYDVGERPTFDPEPIAGVVGVALTRDEGGRLRLLVEVTGPTPESVRQSLEQVRVQGGFTQLATAIGDARPEAGFTFDR